MTSAGFDLEVIVDEQTPPHAVFVTVDGSDLRITVSPRVEADVLTVLNREFAETVAEAIDSVDWEAEKHKAMS